MKIDLAHLIPRTGTKRRTFTVQSYEPLKRDRDALLRIYLRVIRHWDGALGRIVEAYAREMDALVRDSVDDLTAAIDSEGSWFTRIFIELRAEIEAWVLATEAWQRGRWRGAVLSATGIDLDTMLYAGDVQQTLEAALEGNLALIRDVNEQQLSRMKEAVFRGLNQRLPARDVAKELQAIAGFGRKRANLIASVELQKLATALDRERQYQAGVTQFEWKHSKKLHPRPWHAARDGKIYDWATRKEVGGDEVIPADDMPGVPIRCGCRAASYLDLDAMERELDAREAVQKTPAQRNAENEIAAKNYVLSHGRKTGTEHLIGYDLNTGQKFSGEEGGKSHVAFSREMLAAANDRKNSLVFHHNHPSSSSFSKADVNTLIDSPGMKGLWAHGHDDSSYYIERGTSKFSKKKFEQARDQVIVDLQSAVRAKLVTPDEAAAINNHTLMLIMNERKQLRYTHALAGDSAKIAQDKANIINAIVGARK